MKTFALIQDHHVVNVVEFADADALIAALPDFASAYIDVSTRQPRPNVGDAVAYDAAADTLAFTPPTVAAVVVDLAALKREAEAAIDAGCGQERTRYATDIPFQSVLYLYKADEATKYARDVAAGIDPLTQIDTYPLMKAELEGTSRAAHEAGDNSPSKTLLEVATYVTALKPQWVAILAALETQRYYLQAKIDRATDADTVRAIMANPNWPRFG